MTRSAELRRHFLKALWRELRVVWPILSALIVVQLGLGMLVGLREGWQMGEAAYFTFVTGLTIGYGDPGARAFQHAADRRDDRLLRHPADGPGCGGRCPCTPGIHRPRSTVTIADPRGLARTSALQLRHGPA
jgi:hypothetical protein